MEEETIDLTNSFTLADHCGLENIIIDLAADDSFNFSKDNEDLTSSCIAVTSSKRVSHSLCKAKTSCHKKKIEIGDCPICWDQLGKNSLASTKCGHVFCLKCLEKALKIEKKCPTCRHVLNKKTAYHPLYLHIK